MNDPAGATGLPPLSPEYREHADTAPPVQPPADDVHPAPRGAVHGGQPAPAGRAGRWRGPRDGGRARDRRAGRHPPRPRDRGAAVRAGAVGRPGAEVAPAGTPGCTTGGRATARGDHRGRWAGPRLAVGGGGGPGSVRPARERDRKRRTAAGVRRARERAGNGGFRTGARHVRREDPAGARRLGPDHRDHRAGQGCRTGGRRAMPMARRPRLHAGDRAGRSPRALRDRHCGGRDGAGARLPAAECRHRVHRGRRALGEGRTRGAGRDERGRRRGGRTAGRLRTGNAPARRPVGRGRARQRDGRIAGAGRRSRRRHPRPGCAVALRPAASRARHRWRRDARVRPAADDAGRRRHQLSVLDRRETHRAAGATGWHRRLAGAGHGRPRLAAADGAGRKGRAARRFRHGRARVPRARRAAAAGAAGAGAAPGAGRRGSRPRRVPRGRPAGAGGPRPGWQLGAAGGRCAGGVAAARDRLCREPGAAHAVTLFSRLPR